MLNKKIIKDKLFVEPTTFRQELATAINEIFAVNDYYVPSSKVYEFEKMIEEYRYPLLSKETVQDSFANILTGLNYAENSSYPETLALLKNLFISIRKKDYLDELFLQDLIAVADSVKEAGLFNDIILIEEKLFPLSPAQETIVYYSIIVCDYSAPGLIIEDEKNATKKKMLGRLAYSADYFNPNLSAEELKIIIKNLKSLVLKGIPINSTAHLQYIISTTLKPLLKCLVVDCDDTLWAGSADEDPLSEILITPEFREFQEMLLKLKKQGVILTIATKNDLAKVMQVLENHPDMVLRPKDFTLIKASWASKAGSILAIAQELGLGLNTFMFLDNSPTEQASVFTELQTLSVPDISGPVPSRTEFLAHFSDQVEVTAEAAQRTELYRQKEVREQLIAAMLAEGKSREEAFQALHLKAYIKEATDFKRLAELSLRTNRFNATGRKYTADELRRLSATPGYKIFSLILEDDIGQDMLVAAMVVRREPGYFSIMYSKNTYWNNIWRIEAFYLSCRGRKKDVEHSFLSYVLDQLQKQSPVLNTAVFGFEKLKNIIALELYVNEQNGCFYPVQSAPDLRQDPLLLRYKQKLNTEYLQAQKEEVASEAFSALSDFPELAALVHRHEKTLRLDQQRLILLKPEIYPGLKKELKELGVLYPELQAWLEDFLKKIALSTKTLRTLETKTQTELEALQQAIDALAPVFDAASNRAQSPLKLNEYLIGSYLPTEANSPVLEFYNDYHTGSPAPVNSKYDPRQEYIFSFNASRKYCPWIELIPD